MPLFQIVSLLMQTGIGKNVAGKAKEALSSYKRPWWLSRRFVGAVIVVCTGLIGHFTGKGIGDGQADQLIEAVDKAIPYLMSYGAALGVFGFTNREK